MIWLLLLLLAVGVFALVRWDQHQRQGTVYRQAMEAQRAPYWYELPGDVIALRPYLSVETATAEANKAAAFGWTVQSVTTTDGHINVGRTVSGAVLTGGISLLLGGSRTKGAVTVTFTREPVHLVGASA